MLCRETVFVHKIKIYSGQGNDRNFNLLVNLVLGPVWTLRFICQEKYKRPKLQDLFWHILWQSSQCNCTIQQNRIRTWLPLGYFKECITSVESANISTVLYKDKSKIYIFLFSTSVKKMSKTEVRKFDRMKEHILVPCLAVVSL